MTRHIVAWNLKDEFTAQEQADHAAQIKEELEALQDKIDGLISIKVKTFPKISGDRQVILNTLFESPEALEAYRIHPLHVKAGQFVRSVVTDRVCLDFED